MDEVVFYTLEWGEGSFSQEGSTPQICRAYSAMVRSEENLPEDAMLLMAISAHIFLFWKKMLPIRLWIKMAKWSNVVVSW